MTNKRIIKRVFEKEFDMENMRSQILLKERRGNRSMNKLLRYAIPTCLILMTCSIIIVNNNLNLQKKSSNIKQNRIININNIESIAQARIDASIKNITIDDIKDPWPGILKGKINISQDLDDIENYGIYTRKDKDSNYDNLNCYVYRYFNTESDKEVRIAFSNTNKPVRDYRFQGTYEISKINNVELIIYKYNSLYFTEFKFNNYNFDIETNDLNIEELVVLLESIIS